MAAEMDVDREVREAFFKGKSDGGVFVEIGAARPDFLSISASFRSLGWKIIAVEANPDFCALHRALGYNVYEYACSDVESDDANFFIVDSLGADYLGGSVSFESFSSLGIKDEFHELHETVKDKTKTRSVSVKVRRLDTILELHEPTVQHIDILAVDVEGWELNVMRGLSVSKYSPRVIILENLFKKDDYTAYMQSIGYTLWRHLEPNDVYVAADLSPAESIQRPRINWLGKLVRAAKALKNG
ncbi:FkbM family methyltransferase [Methyloferula stellata]|uniref:FkbM family methyltransferase n=1 Tax=Methyloferula stellata TaxID=876270 RepID=UPI0003658FDF|nr:FkbM family methyltransferase [Methyloferula stellata]